MAHQKLILETEDKCILEKAKKLVNGNRRKDYGDISTNMNDTAKLLTGYLQSKYNIKFKLSKFDIPKIMVLLKMGRTITAEKEKRAPKEDNYVDLVGYTYLEHKMLLES